MTEERKLFDYRGDCWKGYKDVRLRLKQMKSGQGYSFIVSMDMAARMDRVVMINDGRIVNKQQSGGDMVYTVVRTWWDLFKKNGKKFVTVWPLQPTGCWFAWVCCWFWSPWKVLM